MTTRIYLVRHGHNDYTIDEQRPLSKKGKKDAEALVNCFENMKLDAAYSSPYKRAVETIEPVCMQRGLKITYDEAFKERVLSSGCIEDFQTTLEQLWLDKDYKLKGGESNEEAKKRGVEGIERLLKLHPNQNIIIGTHGNIMTLMMNHYDASYDYEFWKKLQMPAVFCMVFEDTHTTIEYILN